MRLRMIASAAVGAVIGVAAVKFHWSIVSIIAFGALGGIIASEIVKKGRKLDGQ